MSDPTAGRATGPVLRTTVPSVQLTAALQQQLAGTASVPGVPLQPVVWTDSDSEAVMYPDKVRVAVQPGLLLVEVQMVTDQTGATPAKLVVPFSIGGSLDDATLVAVTEDVPRGDSLLTARWGPLVQEAIWQALLRAGAAMRPVSAAEPALVLAGVFAEADAVTYVYTRPVAVAEIVDYLSRPRRLVVPDLAVAIPVTPVSPLAPATPVSPTTPASPTVVGPAPPRTPP